MFEEEVTKPITKEDFDQMPRKMEFSFTEAGLTASFKFKDQDASISLTFKEEEWGKVKDRDLSLFYVDEETRTLVYPGPVELAPKEEAPYYIDNLAPRELTVDKSKIQRMSAVDVGSLLRDLAGDEIILYTGAGISMAGEEPVWGMNQFKNALGLLDGSFIEAFTSQDKTSLDRILSNLHEFRRQLFTDVTTDAHKAITQIVKQRPGTLVMTENIDLKHEAEGSRLDALHLDNPEERGFDVIKARKVPKVLITVGLSLDDRAVIQYLKQKNPDMKIVSFTRSSVPAFLDETDAVVLGDAQETLPEVAEELSAIPRAVLDELAARPVEELSFKDMSAFFKKYFGQLKYKAVTSDAEFTLEGLFKAPARVQEGYSIEEHTERVFNNLESQLASIDKGKEIPLEDPINLYTFMRVIMTLHDIGKPLALTTAKQHKETPIIMNDLMSRLGFKESQINLAIELVTSNVLGYVLREVPFTANDGFHEIKESSQKTGLDIQTYFDMLKIVYISDAGSYPSLIHLFEERDGRLYIDSRFTEVTRLERMISGELVPKKRDTFLYTLEGEDVRVKFLEGIPATKEEGDERVLAAFQFYLQNSEDPSILDEIEQRFGLKPLFESPRPEEVEAAAIITEERFTLTFAQRKILKDSLEYMVITQEVYDEALRTNTMPEDRAYVEKVLYWLDPEHIEITAKWWSVGKGDVSILEDMLRRAGEEGAASIAWIIDSGLATVTPEMKARIDSLIEQLTGDDSDIAESKLALDIGNPAVPALIEALKSSNAKLREGAAGTFTRGFNHPKIAPALIEALKVETDQGIKYTILEALKANPHPDAIPILIQNYDFDRKATARALEAIGGEEVIEYVSTINEVPAAEKSEILSANKETLDVLANFERPLAGEERDFLYHTTDLLLMPQIYSSGGLKGQKVGERDAFMDEMLLKVRPDLADRGFSRTYALYAHLDKTLSGIDTMPDIVLRIKVPEESVIVADAENVVRSGTLQLSIDKATLYWEGAKDLKTYRQELEAGEVSVERMEALIKDPVPNEQIQIYQYPADIQVLFKKLGVKSATEALALEGITPSQKQFLDELLEKGQITREEYDEAIRTGKMPFVASAEGELAVPSEGFGYEEVFEEAPDLEQIVQTSFEQQVKQQRVSIVIPAYKETEQTLGRLLNRLAEQQISDDEAFNKDNLEVIVSIGTEGPDTDTSIKVVEDFIRNNPGMNVKVEINMPLGPGGQRNSGARLASNDLLLFLDSDVDIEKDFLWKGIFEMKNKDLQVAGTYAELKDPEFDILDKAFWGMTNTAMRASQYVNPQALGQTIFVDKELYEQVGGFDETVKFAEDARFVNAAAKTAGIGSFRMLEDTTTGLNRRRFTEDRGMLYLRLIGATIKNTFGGKVKAAWYPFGEYEDTSTSVEIIEPEALPEQTEAPITDFTGFTEELRREKPTLVDIVQKIATEQEKIAAKESFIANVQGRDVNTNERPISPMYGILNRANAAEVFSRDLGEKIAPGMYGGKAVIYRDDLGKLNIAFMTETKSTHHRHALATLVGLENPGSQRFYDGDLDSPESASLLQRSAGFEFLYDANKGEIIDIRQDSWITKRQIERGIQVSDIENFVLTLFENIDEDLLSEDFKDANWLDNPELSQHILLYAST
ncbi:glycosyltransferase [Candidatus Woesearchaeota archaeon]|nr:glycosyltransferase [Candidatus Woesearchaeota archaeon]